MNPQKKLKLILASLKDRQIIKYFEVFSAHYPDQLKKTIRQISFNCYESVCQFKNKVVSGYGKNSHESFVNSVRTLIELLADDSKLHSIMRQSLKISQQSPSNNCESQKKLNSIDKVNQGSMKNVSLHASIKPSQKKSTLKQEIFEYLNLDNLKISNPNANHKTKTHEKYMNQPEYEYEQDQPGLEQILKRNKQLQQQIQRSKEENVKLKEQLRLYKKEVEQTQYALENQASKNPTKQLNSYGNTKPRQSFEPLKTRTNDYLNMSQDAKILEKSKMRSASVEANQTQKYMIPKGQKKITVPKLNLQVLPNYHGKSNKSLNQSLMEVYQKSHLK